MIDYYKLKHNLDSIDLQILELGIGGSFISYSDLSRIFKLSREGIRKKVNKLKNLGLIEVTYSNGTYIITNFPDTEGRKNGCPVRTDYKEHELIISELVVLDKLVSLYHKKSMYIRDEDFVFISYKLISNDCNVPYNTVKKYMMKFEKMGLISKKKIGRHVYIKINQALSTFWSQWSTFWSQSNSKNPNKINDHFFGLSTFWSQWSTFWSQWSTFWSPTNINNFIINNKNNKNLKINNNHNVCKNDITNGGVFDMDIEDIKNNIKNRHKSKDIKNITNAIVYYKATVGKEVPITPADKTKLKKILQFCKENSIDYKVLINTFVNEWNSIVSKFGDKLKYLGVDFKYPTISVLYDTKVLLFLYELMKVNKDVVLVNVKEEGGFLVGYFSDGTKKLITREDLKTFSKGDDNVR